MLDRVVVAFGMTIENAAQELHNVGSKDRPEWKPKYTMAQLLDEGFRLPRPERPERPQQAQGGGVGALLALAGRSGGAVKVFRGKGGG